VLKFNLRNGLVGSQVVINAQGVETWARRVSPSQIWLLRAQSCKVLNQPNVDPDQVLLARQRHQHRRHRRLAVGSRAEAGIVVIRTVLCLSSALDMSDARSAAQLLASALQALIQWWCDLSSMISAARSQVSLHAFVHRRNEKANDWLTLLFV